MRIVGMILALPFAAIAMVAQYIVWNILRSPPVPARQRWIRYEVHDDIVGHLNRKLRDERYLRRDEVRRLEQQHERELQRYQRRPRN